MTSPRFRAAVMAAGLAVVPLSPHAAGQPPAPAGPVLVAGSHVRGLDKLSLQVLQQAVACSPTVAGMVSNLEASDLLVGIQVHLLRMQAAGDLSVLAAAGGVRHVRIRLRTPNSMTNLLWVLGHELHHALEVAGASEVRDGASLRRYYVRHGWEFERGGFETEAAIEVGRLVAREVTGCRAR